MRGIEAEKQAIRALVLRQLGIDPNQPRGFAGQAGSLGQQGNLLRLPATLAAQADLQDAAGNFYYTPDFSTVDGSDILA